MIQAFTDIAVDPSRVLLVAKKLHRLEDEEQDSSTIVIADSRNEVACIDISAAGAQALLDYFRKNSTPTSLAEDAESSLGSAHECAALAE